MVKEVTAKEAFDFTMKVRYEKLAMFMEANSKKINDAIDQNSIIGYFSANLGLDLPSNYLRPAIIDKLIEKYEMLGYLVSLDDSDITISWFTASQTDE